jgi:acetoin utilization deacetylase AcuC-like enzyme
MRRPLFYCDHHEFPLPPEHRFPVRKYRIIRELLAQIDAYEFVPADLAPLDEIERAHDPAYVHSFVAGALPASMMRRIGFPWSEGLIRRTLASVGGTLAASRFALENGWGGNLAGGTHHAFRAEGSGFCVFNDIAIAILALRAEAGVERAAVIDLDVHQGDGTASIFESDANVFTVSVHGKNNFPFRKQHSRLDVELPDRISDDEYLDQVERILPRVFDFRPGAIFYQSGVDALESDRLGRLSLSICGLERRDRVVLQACRNFGAPFVITLGGGYSDPIELTAQAHANTFRLAAEILANTAC